LDTFYIKIKKNPQQKQINNLYVYALRLLTLKSSKKRWSPLFGATCSFNHQIQPYDILFLSNLDTFYIKIKKNPQQKQINNLYPYIWTHPFKHLWASCFFCVWYFWSLKKHLLCRKPYNEHSYQVHWRVLKNGDPHYLVLHAALITKFNLMIFYFYLCTNVYYLLPFKFSR
jgi:hypothetical protein